MHGLEVFVNFRGRGEREILGENSRVPDLGLMTGRKHRPVRIQADGQSGLASDRREWIGSVGEGCRPPQVGFGLEDRLGHHHLVHGFMDSWIHGFMGFTERDDIQSLGHPSPSQIGQVRYRVGEGRFSLIHPNRVRRSRSRR
jgi:hypothetical protein